MGRRTALLLAATAGLLLLTACTAQRPSAAPSPAASAGRSPTVAASAARSSPAPTPPSAPPSGPPSAPPRFRAAAAMADVRLLAGRIGPRLATSAAYRRAGRVVERRFEDLGYDVRRETFRVPAGDSWGVPVRGGRSFNVVAEPPGLDATRPHVVVGAHLDTVAVAPGAEDNASGVAVLLELARLATLADTRLPVVWIAFGAEEPRGPGEDLHHFGSQHHVRRLAAPRRAALVSMVSLDRVGVGSFVPVCRGPLSGERVQRSLLRAAASLGVPARACENTASDHWSFAKDGVAAARLGSTSYAAYHSAADRPSVVAPGQLGRTGRVAWAWLSGR